MWLCWDWRLARVLNPEGDVIDEIFCNRLHSAAAIATQITTIERGGMTPDARILAERFPEADARSVSELKQAGLDWPIPDSNELELLDAAALLVAQAGVAAAAGDPDRRLEHLVRAKDELRAAWTTMESRMVEWAGLFLPELDLDAARTEIPAAFAGAATIEAAAAKLDTEAADAEPGEAEWAALKGWAAGVIVAQNRIEQLEQATRKLVEVHLPSLSALLGPLLAARICVTAHGRVRLARLPAGTIQVLGAEKAFFMHLKTGIDPPKHGHLFQHPWVHRSPLWVRGKVARLLANKSAIAARVDNFGGQAWDAEQVQKIEQAIMDIRQRFPRPKGKAKGNRHRQHGSNAATRN